MRPWLWLVAWLYLCWEAFWSAVGHGLENAEEAIAAAEAAIERREQAWQQ